MNIHKDASTPDQQEAGATEVNNSCKARSGSAKKSVSSAAKAPPTATPAQPPQEPVKERQDLLLWALANGLEPADGWFRSAQLTRRDLSALAREHGDRYARLRLLEIVGTIIERRHLDVLLRARLAEMLLCASGPRELTEIARVFEKLPEDHFADEAAMEDSDADLDSLDLAGAMSEARRLLGELESDPEVKRLLAQTNNNGALEGPPEAS